MKRRHDLAGDTMTLISFDEALALIAAAARPLPTETVPLDRASGRVLAAPVMAAIDSPRADLSMMDGYAVRDRDAVAGAMLRLVGTSAPGARFGGSVGEGEAVRIFTGAALPAGAQRIVIQENVRSDGDQVTVAEPNAERFVRARASDFAAGDEVLARGMRLTPGALVAAAGAGAGKVQVTRRPRILSIATGDELRPPGAPLDGPDRIPDSIGAGLAVLLAAMGAEPIGHQLLADDLRALETAAAAAVQTADLVVVTGGASVGAHDHAKAMFAPLGLDLIFSKVAIKPGKPVWLGRVGETWVIGLPGNPTSAMVTARLLLAPMVAFLLGQRLPAPLEWIPLALAEPIPATGDRETFVRATLGPDGLVPLANQDSGAQRALAEANWLVRCPADSPAIPAGAAVRALAF